MVGKSDVDGCLNPSADNVKREDLVWSDTNPTQEYTEQDVFKRLTCRNCGAKQFEVLSVEGMHETLAHCICGLYYIVHTG